MAAEWELLEEKPLHQGFRRIVGRQYRLPNGAEHLFEIMDNPDSVAVFALTPGRQVILARQFRTGPQRWLDEMPGGIVDPGEDPLEAARRELLEETGYAGAFTYLGSAFYSAYAVGRRHVVLATDCVQVAEAALEETEHVELVFKDIDAFKRQVLAGDLTDAYGALRGLAELRLI